MYIWNIRNDVSSSSLKMECLSKDCFDYKRVMPHCKKTTNTDIDSDMNSTREHIKRK